MSANRLAAPFTTLTIWEPNPEILYTIDHAAQFAGLSRRHIVIYVRFGLITLASGPAEGGWFFTADTIRMLRRVESLRATHRFNITNVRFVLGLLKEIERLRAEMDYPYDY